MNQREYVTLVDPLDKVIGNHEKLIAHKAGLLHRAFSIFIFNSKIREFNYTTIKDRLKLTSKSRIYYVNLAWS